MDNFPMDHSSLLEIIQAKLKDGLEVEKVSNLLLKHSIYVPVSILEFIKDRTKENDG